MRPLSEGYWIDSLRRRQSRGWGEEDLEEIRVNMEVMQVLIKDCSQLQIWVRICLRRVFC